MRPSALNFLLTCCTYMTFRNLRRINSLRGHKSSKVPLKRQLMSQKWQTYATLYGDNSEVYVDIIFDITINFKMWSDWPDEDDQPETFNLNCSSEPLKNLVRSWIEKVAS